jgi:hypothetical protein
MLTARPKTINGTLPFDAPAMARMLSVDMVRSANTTYQMACNRRLGAGAESGGALASTSTFTAIQTMNRPPASCTYGMRSRRAAKMVSAIRRSTAPAAPHAVPMRRSRRGRERTAMAITSALSPASSQVDQDDREDAEQEVAYGHGRSGRPIHALARRR